MKNNNNYLKIKNNENKKADNQIINNNINNTPKENNVKNALDKSNNSNFNNINVNNIKKGSLNQKSTFNDKIKKIFYSKDNKIGIIGEKKINLTKVYITVTIIFILFILSVISVYNKILKEKNNKETDKLSKELIQMQQNNIQEAAELKRQQEEKAEKKYEKLSEEEIENAEKIYRHSDVKRVFLTFDDGPTKQVTPYILELLKQENIKASFFVLGKRVNENPELVKREYEEGHFIGNHGYSHQYAEIYQSIDKVFEEYNETNEAIKKAVNNEKFNSLIFRFPGGLVGGKYNDLKKEASLQLKENGIANVDWNALTSDADNARTKETIMNSFYKTIKDKTSVVLLMHDASDKILTYETLPDIINYFKENNYKFETLFDVINR